MEKFKVLFGDSLSGSLNVSVPTEVPFKVFSAMLKLESLTTGFSFTSRIEILTVAVSDKTGEPASDKRTFNV